jgi:conjugative relaxase-like TrwC/TraI family protein
MLNIGKLLQGQADYYLDAVARSQEEYYTGAGEAPGYWLGQAAQQLGLAGEVTEDGLHRMLAGAHPLTAVRLSNPPRGQRVAGFDLTFRAPKSVSLLYGLGGFQTASQVRAAHEQAITAALDYLERHAAVVSRGHARERQERAAGLVAAAFQHRTSRAGDPLLHTHVVVANLGQGSDGRWTSVDGRPLYRHAKTAGYLYQAVLRAELTRRIGVAWNPVHNGVADVRGIRRPVIEAFSQRRRQIHQRLAELGHRTARAAQAAALETRPIKDKGISQARLRASWHRRAAALGFTGRSLAAVLDQATLKRPTQAELRTAVALLASTQGLTLHASTFTRRHVLQGLCDALPPGCDVGVADLEALAERFLARGDLVQAVTANPRPRWTDSGARDHPRPSFGAAGEWHYTTRELLATEAAAVQAAIGRRAQGVGVVPAVVLDRVLAAHRSGKAAGVDPGGSGHPVLSDEQAAMVHALVTSGDGVQVVNAKAGSGKTTALRVAGEAWQRAGYRVIGAALAARAARQLQQSAGIPADTIAKLLGDLDNPSAPGMDPGLVLVIDEAGMVGTRQLAHLLAHAHHAGAKVVLVGDVHQLPEIEAGGLFGSLAQRLRAIQLQENRRQRQPWEQQALDLLRTGNAVAAIARYAQHGRIVVASRAGRLRDRLVQEWWEAAQQLGERAPVMIALRRADVTDLNQRARALLARHGRLGPHPISIGGREFTVGDRIVTLRNARRLGVLNGTFATVTSIDHQARALQVRTDEGLDLLLPRWYLDSQGWLGDRRRVDHAYAITCHKAQGMTTERAYVLASDDLYQQWGYVAMSRGQLSNHLYITAGEHSLADELDIPMEPERDGVLAITEALEQSHAQYLALDQTDPALIDAGRPTPPGGDAQRPQPAPARAAFEPHQELVTLHRAHAIQLLHAREQLAAQRLGWRQRRLLAKAIHDHQQELQALERQLARLPTPTPLTPAGAPPTSPTGPGAGPAAHRHGPPRHLVTELGGWPHTAAAQALWRLAATRIETYRAHAGITDPKTALGPPPDDPGQHTQHQALTEFLASTVQAIDTLDRAGPHDLNDDRASLELP